MIKKVLLIFVIIISIGALSTNVYAKAHSSAHSSHSSTHSTTHSTKSITGAKSTPGKTYTTPKSFTSKYNSSNIKTNKVVENPNNYTKYSVSNTFRPNFWTAMWAFQCMHDNTEEVTEQDIAKELEERGYTEDEINEIIQDGENAKQLQSEEEKKEAYEILGGIGIALIIAIIIILVIEFLFP